MLSRKQLEHSIRDATSAIRYITQKCRYEIRITLKELSTSLPAPHSVEISSFNNQGKRCFAIVPERNDRRRLSEFVFLLSAKLKFDLLRGLPFDGAGFLHSNDIIKLNGNNLTKVQKSVYAALNRLHNKATRNQSSPEAIFLRKIFIHPDQLRHLIYSFGRTGDRAASQDLIWWLNIGRHDVTFLNESENAINDDVLKKQLSKLFPEKCLLNDHKLKSFIEKYFNNEPTVSHQHETTVSDKDDTQYVLNYPSVAPIYPREKLVEMAVADSWLDLYQKNLVEDLPLPSYHIPLKCSQVDYLQDSSDYSNDILRTSYSEYNKPKAKKYTGSPLLLNQVIEKHKNILLTGDSGAGKTTELRYLANYCLSHKPGYIPFYIELEDFVPFLFESINKFLRISLRELFGRSVATLFLKRTSDSKLIDALGLTPYKQGQEILSEDLFDGLVCQFATWFEAKGVKNQKVLLLIDDLNKISPFLRNALICQLNSLFQEQCTVVISCRLNIAETIFHNLHAEVAQFELQEVSNEQIINYINNNTSVDGEDIFKTRIERDKSLCSIVKTPFFLNLLARLIRSGKNVSSINRAELIQYFVTDRIENWHPEKVLSHANVQKDLIWTILPTVAKWTIDVSTSERQIARKPFYLSKEFKSIKEPSGDIYKALEIGEACGLLKTSGLKTESRYNAGYPAFIHDYVRDYFAAQYFLGHDSHQLLKEIKKHLEYYAWDEALLQFLELNSDVEIFKHVVEYVLSHDPLFAVLCVKYSKVADDQFCIGLGNRLRADHIFDNMSESDRKMFSRSFGRHALTDIWEKASFAALLEFVKTSESDFGHWLALGSNATDESIPILRSLRELPFTEKTDSSICVQLALSKINTLVGFKAATELYKEISNSPRFKDFWVTLFDMSYSPTFSELYGTFPHDKYPIELNYLLDTVRNITNNELGLLNSLILPAKKNEPTSMNACKLLARSSISNSVDILFRCYERFYSDTVLFDMDKHELLKILLQKSPQRAIKLLIQEVKRKHGYLNKYDYWEMIVSRKEDEAIEHVIKYAYEGELPSSVLCMDSLCSWPKKEVIACFKSIFNTEESLTDRATLLGAIIGDDGCSQKAYSIFEDIYSVLVRGKIPPVPETPEIFKRSLSSLDSSIRKLLTWSKKRWKEFCCSRAVDLLLFAVRTISKSQDNETFQKLHHIIEWSYPYVTGRKEFQGSHQNIGIFSDKNKYKYIIWEIFGHSLSVLSEHRSSEMQLAVIEPIINNDMFSELLKTSMKSSILRKPASFIDIDERLNDNIMLSRLVSALGQLIQNMPSKQVLQILETTKDMYLETFKKTPEQIGQLDYIYLSKIVVNAIKRVDNESICDYLQLLDKLKHHSKEGERKAQSLIDKIKSTTGRRYLPFL